MGRRPPYGWDGRRQPPPTQQQQQWQPPYGQPNPNYSNHAANYYAQNAPAALLLNSLPYQQQIPNYTYPPLHNQSFPIHSRNFTPSPRTSLAPGPQTKRPAAASQPPPPGSETSEHKEQLSKKQQLEQPQASSPAQKQTPPSEKLGQPKQSTPQSQQLQQPGKIPASSLSPKSLKKLEQIEQAVQKARRDLLSAKENVSAWKVSQAALVALKVESWDSLKFKMQEIPSLHRLIVTEGKINAFIHCFVGVRRITTLYDLDLAICENEGIGHFEELELGPLLQHPLVLHYFSVDAHCTEVFKITSEDVILALGQFMDTCKKQTIIIDDFFNFLSKKQSTNGHKMLGVRVQSFGMHISFIKEARRSENIALGKCRGELARKSANKEKPTECGDEILKKWQKAAANKYNVKGSKRPLFSKQKESLDKRFLAVRLEMETFAAANTDFSGKHIRFVSSSSEDEESDDSIPGEKMTNNDAATNSSLSSQNVSSSHRASSCPYPSATEEMSRLGLISEIGQSPASGSSRHKASSRTLSAQRRRKRKREEASCNISSNSKLVKGDKAKYKCLPNGKEAVAACDIDLTLSLDSIRTFVTRWKEACKTYSVSEVLERMLELSNTGTDARHKEKAMLMFSLYPFIGLLNVALRSIKFGLWDSMYDSIQSAKQFASINILPPKSPEYEIIDVEPAEKTAAVVTSPTVQQRQSATVEEIIAKLSGYYEVDNEAQSNDNSLLQKKFMSLRRLCRCELWLADQFGVSEFKSLGFGEFFAFLREYASRLPSELQKLLAGDISEKAPVEVSMGLHQLVVLVSQALNGLSEEETITRRMIDLLLKQQFPVLSFKIMENGSMEEFLQIVGNYKNSVMSKCLIFSATLLEAHHVANSSKGHAVSNDGEARSNTGKQMMNLNSDTPKEAIKILLKAPMLSDLNLWAHWDLKFGPSLGPLVEWLLNEVNHKDLLCLVTKNGKVIRIDQSATADSFLEAALLRSPFQTAVKLLSLFALAGNGGHVPLFLLKCYSCRAFEVILKDQSENTKVKVKDKCISHGKVVDGVLGNHLAPELQQNLFKMNQVALVASRFVLDCLGWIPSEFHGLAADVLLSGMQSVVKEAPLAMLCECNHEERLMLHEIGLSIGILEWIDDYHAFCSSGMTDMVTSSGPSYVEAARPDFSCAVGETTVTLTEDEPNEESTQLSSTIDGAMASSSGTGEDYMAQLSVANNYNDATLVIESIRREEFGVDPNFSNTESYMLKKQHARLGRALHCLSQELYSQDSHFLLELVQNADDNTYPEKNEPSLAFILQESGIIVLNNEQGFSAENIRALCDVGNSTKKGSGSGYIGQKGIGFKSVFRITDAPEIHSNGFHIKFDIREGEIGFVLPTAVPPCDISLYSGMLCRPYDQVGNKCWNTCIVLPFRSKLSEETAMKMFSDLHPSLLLFLQRLRCIIFRNTLNDSLIVMRKETFDGGIVKVSCGNEKMSWLVASQKLQAHACRPRVQTTEIAIAFTLEESDNGEYNPRLEQQLVFSFLPLRTYGLKFILQGDFILPSSREEVDRNNPWNEWLLTKVPGLFVSAEKSFCALSCFKENPGKAISAYMSFVPIVGEVQGFFSGLPQAITQELRRTSCLLLEGGNRKMVPPCNVLRGWDEQARYLLPGDLLQEHLGLGLLDKNIVLSDALARALGIREYGPEVLIKFMTNLCRSENTLKSMGLCWLSSWLNTIYTMLYHSSWQTDLLDNLQHLPFIPLSDGTYSSVDVGTIWLHSDPLSTEFGGAHGLEAFPKLYAKLRTVNPALLSASASDRTFAENVTQMLQRIGVQQLSAHEIIKIHVLQDVSDPRVTDRDKDLMIEYICFVMIHLQSGCPSCCDERKHIFSELQNKAYIWTNHGYRRPSETPIHFSSEYGNPVNVKSLINGIGMKWHEVDTSYLKHPASKSLSIGLTKWREFFQEIGVTDFVQVFEVDKSIAKLSPTILKDMTWDADLISSGSTAKDFESPELEELLSRLPKSGNRECCKRLLEVFDLLWDDSFSNKTTCYITGNTRAFKSSFIINICDVMWVASSMDSTLHYPRDLFYDCEEVRSILGASAPYALPKVKSRKLVSDVGFKTEVTIDDTLEILSVWRKFGMPFKSSITEMEKLYTFIWDKMSTSKNKILEAFHGVPFIFVPFNYGSRHGDLVAGEFLSAEEVCWHDPTGSLDQMKGIHPQCSSSTFVEHPLRKTLANVYRGLHDFFVSECGVCEIPSCRGYLCILQQLSAVALPSEVASTVFQIFLKWGEALKSGLLNSEDICYLKESLSKLDYKVLPSILDKWVSLHPSFGLLCWCDDTELKRRFKAMKNIDFLNFGNLGVEEQQMLHTKVSPLLQKLGIPALSQVVTREAIYYGPADCNLKASLVNWALPYAQRYMYTMHHDKYLLFKDSGFSRLEKLQIVVVEKLSYKSVIKQCGISSSHGNECSCLLQGETLYTTVECDSHTLFLELSRLFYDGVPELHFANFLHMITTMAESGSTEDQTEFFIINSQKVPKLPDEEPIWPLPSITQYDAESIQAGASALPAEDQNASKPKSRVGIGSCWPPTDWKTAPGFDNAHRNGFKKSGVSLSSSFLEANKASSLDFATQSDSVVLAELETDWTMEVEAEKVGEHFTGSSSQILSADPNSSNQTPNSDLEISNHALLMNLNNFNQTPIGKPSTSKRTPCAQVEIDDLDLSLISNFPELHSFVQSFFMGNQLNSGIPNPALQVLTGRVGERVAYQYLVEKFGTEVVKWVNKDNETGLPFDIVIGEDESTRKYVEVKATISTRKDWFIISAREWQFAVEKGDSFSVVHVLLGNALARLTTIKNPVKQCQLGNLKLVLKMLSP